MRAGSLRRRAGTVYETQGATVLGLMYSHRARGTSPPRYRLHRARGPSRAALARRPPPRPCRGYLGCTAPVEVESSRPP